MSGRESGGSALGTSGYNLTEQFLTCIPAQKPCVAVVESKDCPWVWWFFKAVPGFIKAPCYPFLQWNK